VNETTEYCLKTTVTNELQSFVDFLSSLQLPLSKDHVKVIWEFLCDGGNVLSREDYSSVFRHALQSSKFKSGEKRLSRAFAGLAASMCTNELLRKLRAILNTPSNFAQPLLGRLSRRNQHRLSSTLDRDSYYSIFRKP